MLTHPTGLVPDHSASEEQSQALKLLSPEFRKLEGGRDTVSEVLKERRETVKEVLEARGAPAGGDLALQPLPLGFDCSASSVTIFRVGWTALSKYRCPPTPEFMRLPDLGGLWP